jgi:hypothetical protein
MPVSLWALAGGLDLHSRNKFFKLYENIRMFHQTKAATLQCCVVYCSRPVALYEMHRAVLC